MEDLEETNNSTGNTSVGDGIGCFLLIIALAIFFSFPRILDLIELVIKCHK